MARGPGDGAEDGEVVVRAVVHARLLGLRILSLDARVVVGRAPLALNQPDGVPAAVPSAVSAPPSPRALRGGHTSDVALRPAHDSTTSGSLARAIELLADGEQTLASCRKVDQAG